MTGFLRGILIIAIIIYFIIVVKLLKKRQLSLKYSLLWFLMGFVMLFLVLFPHVLEKLCHLVGFVDTMNGLFTFVLAFVMILLMALTSIVSKQSEKIKSLVQDNAFLEKRLRDIEESNDRNNLSNMEKIN